MTITGTGGRGVGRPRSFKPDDKVAAAMEIFWQNGYEATSLDDLSRRLGLSRSSFYACFGSKRGVLFAALKAYSANNLAKLGQIADAAPSSGDAVRAMLRATALTDDGPHGCLLVNCIAELAPRDEELSALSREHIGKVEAAVAAALASACSLAPGQAATRARALVAIAIGALTMRKTGVPEREIEALLTEIETFLAPQRTGLTPPRAADQTE